MKKILLALPGALPDGLIVAGGSSLAYGASLLHPAAGFIVAGVLMLAVGYINARKAAE